MTDPNPTTDDSTDSELVPDGGEDPERSEDTDSGPDDGIGSGLSEGLDADQGDDDASTRTVVEKKTVVKGESRSAVEWLELAAVAGLIVVATVTGIGVYSNASAAINRLISPSWVPLFQAGFNLALLLLALAGLSLLARRRLDLA